MYTALGIKWLFATEPACIKDLNMIKMRWFSLFMFTLICSTQSKDLYVDAVYGSVKGNGSFQSPYKSIQNAADNMEQGDICYIRKGTYRETVRPAVDGVTFTNYKNEYVLITGLDSLSGTDFEVHAGNIFKTTISNTVKQVFVDGKRMDWARWPNDDGDMLNRDDMRSLGIDTIRRDSKILGKATLLEADPFITSKPSNYWAGAKIVDVADSRNIFTANRGTVLESEGITLIVDSLVDTWKGGNPIFLNKGGVGYLIGHLGLLDYPKEWHWEDNELYLYPPKGKKLDSLRIEVRTRTYGFDLKGRVGIAIKNLHFKAAAVIMENSKDCILDSISSRYGSSFPKFHPNGWGSYNSGDAAIHISGNNNVVKNSYVGQTWGHGISLWANNSTLENNIIEQCNWIGERKSPVFAPGDDNTIIRNTIRDAGRDGIELGNHNWVRKFAFRAKVQYNKIYNCGFLAPDAGSIYVNHQGYRESQGLANTDISYNIIHDFKHPWYSALGGIYLDNGSSGYKVHHNIIWNVRGGIKANSTNYPDEKVSRGIEIYHNTIVNAIVPVHLNFAYDKNSKTKPFPSTEVIVKNNHADDARKGERLIGKGEKDFSGTDLANNRCDGNIATTTLSRLELSEFVDAVNNDYLLLSGSPSINAGVVIPGINDMGDGSAVGIPDIGALEYGGIDWRSKVGAKIRVPYFYDEEGYPVQAISTYKESVRNDFVIKSKCNSITIKTSASNSPWTVQVFDVRGRMLFIKRNITQSSYVIPKTSFAKGYYVLKASVEGHSFIKMISVL